MFWGHRLYNGVLTLGKARMEPQRLKNCKLYMQVAVELPVVFRTGWIQLSGSGPPDSTLWHFNWLVRGPSPEHSH